MPNVKAKQKNSVRIIILFWACLDCFVVISVEKKPVEEPEVKNDDDEVPPQNSSAADEDDKSREQMTSSDPERGDSCADKQQQTCASPSADETTQTTAVDDSQIDVQATTSTPIDVISSPTAERKENSDKPETASSGIRCSV